MENKISVCFNKEKDSFVLDISQPDLNGLIHLIIENHYDVSVENVTVTCDDEEAFDCETFKNMLVEVHEEFVLDIDNFFDNIKKDIETYYDDEELSKYIIDVISKE